MHTSSPNWAKIKEKATKPQVWYLNDHVTLNPRLRIESMRSGDRTLWRAKTSMKKMLETKRYLEKVWGI